MDIGGWHYAGILDLEAVRNIEGIGSYLGRCADTLDDTNLLTRNQRNWGWAWGICTAIGGNDRAIGAGIGGIGCGWCSGWISVTSVWTGWGITCQSAVILRRTWYGGSIGIGDSSRECNHTKLGWGQRHAWGALQQGSVGNAVIASIDRTTCGAARLNSWGSLDGNDWCAAREGAI